MNRRGIRLMAAGVAASAVALSACSTRSDERSASSSPPPVVAVAKITRGDVRQALTVTGEFRPFQEIDVHAKVAGFLKTIYVDVGDRVEAGQLLAVLEIPELQDEIQRDEAGVKRAEEEINRAQADLDRAQSVSDVAHLGATRLASVVKARPNLVAQQDVDEATSRDRVALAQVATAQAVLASSRQQLELANAAARMTKTLFAYAQITAPFAGVITHRYADTGAMIQAGTASQTQTMPLVRLSQNARLRLVIPVPESAVSGVHIGASVDITVQSQHRSLTGTVARFSNRLDTDTRTMPVEVDVPNADLSLAPGMYADAILVLREVRDVPTAPLEALDRAGTSTRVLVVRSDGHIEGRDVSIGLEASDRVQILSGLDAGDLVVVGNRSQLKAGAIVSPKLIGAAR